MSCGDGDGLMRPRLPRFGWLAIDDLYRNRNQVNAIANLKTVVVVSVENAAVAPHHVEHLLRLSALEAVANEFEDFVYNVVFGIHNHLLIDAFNAVMRNETIFFVFILTKSAEKICIWHEISRCFLHPRNT